MGGLKLGSEGNWNALGGGVLDGGECVSGIAQARPQRAEDRQKQYSTKKIKDTLRMRPTVNRIK